MKKNHSIIVHAVHSRLQLIRNKLNFRPDMKPNDLINWNERYFDLVADSVETFHHYKPNRSDFQDAAELFLSTVDPYEDKIKQQPAWRPK